MRQAQNSAAARGQAGVDGSELVALALPPGPALREALESAWAAEQAVAPLDPRSSEGALRTALDELRPASLVTPAGRRRLDGGEPAPADTALVVATSGSTGRPKGVELSHAAVAASVRASLERIGGSAGDRWLCCLPTHHIAGLAVLLRARALGTPAVIHRRFDVAAVAAEAGITHVSLVPTQLQRLLDAGADLARYRAILLGGGPAPPALLARARAAGAKVVTTYGMSETCGGCVYDGAPLAGVNVRIDADGRIRIRGPVLFSGYRRRPGLTAAAVEDGWLRTADLGHWQGDRLVVDGRADDVIVSAGENVPAGAVAAVLREHPAVADAAVLGEPDPDRGEVVSALVVAAGPDRPALGELQEAVAARLGHAAAPRRVRWVASIPRTGLGKVDADALARMREDGHDHRAGR